MPPTLPLIRKDHQISGGLWFYFKAIRHASKAIYDRASQMTMIRSLVPGPLRTNTDYRLSLDPLGWVESSDGMVEAGDLADVCS